MTWMAVQVVIDHWPKLKPYIEIEGNSVEEVINTAKLLGYTKNDLTTKNTTELYQDIGIDIEKMLELTFNSTVEDRMLTGL